MEEKIFFGFLKLTELISIIAIVVSVITFFLGQYFSSMRKKKELEAKSSKIVELEAKLDEPYSFWVYLFENPPSGTLKEALAIDIIEQRKFTKDTLIKLEELEEVYGCGDSELKLIARNLDEERTIKAKAIILNLAKNQIRNSFYHKKGIWREYFENRKRKKDSV